MQLIIHQTHHKIADFDEIISYLENETKKLPGIHVFPELFLTGYPLQDLCLQKPFVTKYTESLTKIETWFKKAKLKDTVLLIGGLEYELSDSGVPKHIRNVVLQYGDKKNGQTIYTKQLLPNYDIFDEKKYFLAGEESKVVEVLGKKIGILICEDMWASSCHGVDPVQRLFDLGQSPEIIINLSASPYIVNKYQKRISRAKQISHKFECPFVYVNRVGAEDEIVFDGHSFIVNGDEIIHESKKFTQDKIALPLPKAQGSYKPDIPLQSELTWESLFNARLDFSGKIPKLESWSDNECQEVLDALILGVKDYLSKNFFKSYTIALSGGMDSAIVLTIIRLALDEGQGLEAIYMPSIYSSPLSHELSLLLCKNLGVPLKSVPIKFLHSATKNLFGETFPQSFEGLTDENVQSRLRGMLLYTRSNQVGSMVVNTSNKSELAVGYSTQYGDSVGAISLIGDLYKSEVYRLAEYLNKKHPNLIPEQIITREPSAELREDQIDSQSLPPYERLDAILEAILNYRYTEEELIEHGFNKEEVIKTFDLYRKSEYKRYQFCPIIKISSKSFGFGYRIPLSKDSNFYHC